MSLYPEREFRPMNRPSPSPSVVSMSSEDTSYSYSPLPSIRKRGGSQHSDRSLPPLREHLRNEGINPRHPTDSTAISSSRYSSGVSPEHADARQDALRRVLRDAHYQRPSSSLDPTRYGYQDRHSSHSSRRAPEVVPCAECTDSCCPYESCRAPSERHSSYEEERHSRYHSPPSPQYYPPASQPFSYSYPPPPPPSVTSRPYSASSRPVHDREERNSRYTTRTEVRRSEIPVKRKLPADFEDQDGSSDGDSDEYRPDSEASSGERSTPDTMVTEATSKSARDARRPSAAKATNYKASRPAEASASDERAAVAAKTTTRPPSTVGSDGNLNSDEDGFFYNEDGVKLEVVELPIPYDAKEWLKHVEKTKEGSSAPWCCTWETRKNGETAICEYSSKKHLVKRHIEATHLKIKRFMCTWCGKTFTQRSNVAGCHLNTHTGEEPHACNFCGERFKDPSKRHKHMTRHHAYRPSKSHKKFKADNGHLAPHESVAFSISSSSSSSVTSAEHE